MPPVVYQYPFIKMSNGECSLRRFAYEQEALRHYDELYEPKLSATAFTGRMGSWE